MPTATLRATLALGLVSSWMALLFLGFTIGGAVHLLVAVALAVTPWKALLRRDQSEESSQSTEYEDPRRR
ncbi:MAG: hypothetical protein AAF481_09615 [Acidobacteriota bacterium]